MTSIDAPPARACRDCRSALPDHGGVGRPRLYCASCRPSKGHPPVRPAGRPRKGDTGNRLRYAPRQCRYCGDEFSPLRDEAVFCCASHGKSYKKVGNRARKWKPPPDHNASVEVRFWNRTKQDGPGGCWLWTGDLNDNGYAVMNFGGKQKRLMHRWAYEAFVAPIPARLTLDHVWEWGCRFRHCVNPEHLEPVTQAENSRRANREQGNGRKHGACFPVGPRVYIERLVQV